MEIKYHIKNVNGFWTVNGSRYEDLSTEEQNFFCEFLKATKLDNQYLFQL